MSITLKERLDLIVTLCEEALKALEKGDLKKIAWHIGGIKGAAESTLGTPRPDIRKVLDEPEPEGWWYPEEEDE